LPLAVLAVLVHDWVLLVPTAAPAARTATRIGAAIAAVTLDSPAVDTGGVLGC